MQSSAPPSGQRDGIQKKIRKIRKKMGVVGSKVKDAFYFAVPALSIWTISSRPSPDQVPEEDTEAPFMYRTNRPCLQADELKVEIRWGNELWVIGGQGDEPVMQKLPRNCEMRLSRATASVSADGMLTVVIPKRSRPRKWYEFKALTFNKFKTVHVEISRS